jgi:hypothetical protein
MPFIYKHVAVMPDCHNGKGATVGTVLATNGAIIPAAVGVDIGCGMVAVKTPLKRDAFKEPAELCAGIERRVPMSVARSNNTTVATAAHWPSRMPEPSPEPPPTNPFRLTAYVVNSGRFDSARPVGCRTLGRGRSLVRETVAAGRCQRRPATQFAVTTSRCGVVNEWSTSRATTDQSCCIRRLGNRSA